MELRARGGRLRAEPGIFQGLLAANETQSSAACAALGSRSGKRRTPCVLYDTISLPAVACARWPALAQHLSFESDAVPDTRVAYGPGAEILVDGAPLAPVAYRLIAPARTFHLAFPSPVYVL